MGYQLPDDVDAVSGLRWYLVAVPDDDAYGIAALGAYTELADVWKWGKEGITADSYTARQQWLSAIDETLEALEMGFPTTLLGYIDEVETLLEAIRDAQQIAQPCCDSTLYNPAPAAIDETTDSVPQVIQDNYTTGDDWGEVWESYMCPLLREAWERIDDHVLEPWEYYINLGGGGVAVLTTLYVAWAGIGAAVVVAGFTIADVLALFAAVKGYIGDAVMGDYSDWDTHADDFICAVRNADGPEAKQTAAEDFIDSLSYSAPVKLLARFAFHSGFWQQVYTGIGADGNEIIVSGDGCPTCTGPQVLTSFFTQYSTTCDVPNPNLVEYPLPREHLTTNVAREFQSVNHRTECSAVSRIDVMLRDDDLANDPIAAPTSFKARYTTFVPDTDAAAALRFYSNTWTILAEYTNAQIVEGDWYTAPANTVRVMWTFDKFNDTVVAELMVTED